MPTVFTFVRRAGALGVALASLASLARAQGSAAPKGGDMPIKNATVHDQILQQVLLANLLDTEQSWDLGPDGTYQRVAPGERPFNLHRDFMTNPSLSGRGTALDEGAQVPKLALRKGAA